MGGNVTKGDRVAKVVLWYLPLLIEIAIHFYTLRLKGHTGYDQTRIFRRSAMTFTIILGGGTITIL